MKWFRHNSDSYSNLKMQELIAEFGAMGYGVFWIACELIAQQGEDYRINGGKNWKKAISNITKVEQEKLDKIFILMADLNMIDKKELAKNCLFIPKMEEYSDDYTNRVRRMSEHSTNKVRKSTPTLHNITLHNNTKTPPPKADGKEINTVIDYFLKINSNAKNFYRNNTQRGAVAELIQVYGFDRVKTVVEKTLPKTNTLSFFPTITTPIQLREKWASLESAVRKQQGESSKKSKVYFS